MLNSCPFLNEEGYGSYFCNLKEDYVDDERYNTFCCQSLETVYSNCPAYKRFESEDLFVGYSTISYAAPRLKEYDD